MGICQSADGNTRTLLASGDDRCPTVFELERALEQKRLSSKRLHVNLVNIEFRRGLFERYEKAGRIMTRSETTKMFVAVHKGTGRPHAVREVALPANRSARAVDELWKGFDAQAVLDHPNICRLQEVFCSEERYYVVTDFCSGGDLIGRLELQGRQMYEEHEAVNIIRRVTEALHHCHSESVVHGDLRVEACLFEDPGPWADVRVIGAGARRGHSGLGTVGSGAARVPLLGSDHSSGSGQRRSGSGRSREKEAWYLAPEMRRGDAISEAGDMWTLGVVAYLVLAGTLPQPGMTQDAAHANVMTGKPLFKGQGWGSRSAQASDFVTRLLQNNPRQRMTAAEALEHPWLGGGEGPIALPRALIASFQALRDSCLLRRLGLRLVGRTVEAAKLVPAKKAFRNLDPSGKGYITEESLTKALQGQLPLTPADGRRNGNASDGAMTIAPTTNGTAPGCELEEHGAAQQHDSDVVASSEARDLFAAMDPEGSGRVGFSAFVAACLAGKPADEAGSRVAFVWLERKRKEAITAADVQIFTGQVVKQRELEEAFADAHDALDLMSEMDARPVAAAVREMEARKSAASGAAGGLTYSEFYRLLAAVPTPPLAHTKATINASLGYGFTTMSVNDDESGNPASGYKQQEFPRTVAAAAACDFDASAKAPFFSRPFASAVADQQQPPAASTTLSGSSTGVSAGPQAGAAVPRNEGAHTTQSNMECSGTSGLPLTA